VSSHVSEPVAEDAADVLIPMLDLNGTADPIEDYLAALQLLEGAEGDVDVLFPRRVHRRS
jgi:hypothetical protein